MTSDAVGSVTFVEPRLLWPLRLQTLRPGQPQSSVHHDYDESPGSVHVGAFDADGEVVACASFVPEPYADGRPAWRLRAMATSPRVRGQGYGARALLFGIAEVRRRGGDLLWCNARSPAVGFYQRLGLRCVGEEFELPDIGPHFLMVLDLIVVSPAC